MATLILFATIVAAALLVFYGFVWAKVLHFAVTEPLLFEIAWRPSWHIVLVPLISAAWLAARIWS